jgi:hypothetical protein
MNKILRKTKFITPFNRSSCMLGLPERSGGRIRSFPLSISFHRGSPCSYVTWGMNNRLVSGSSSETLSYTIDMIIIKFMRTYIDVWLCNISWYGVQWDSELHCTMTSGGIRGETVCETVSIGGIKIQSMHSTLFLSIFCDGTKRNPSIETSALAAFWLRNEPQNRFSWEIRKA